MAGAFGAGLAGALVLTLVFTAQNAAGGAAGWSATIAPNALHWGIWGLFAPVLLFVTRHYRLGFGHRVSRAVLWVAIGIVLSLTQSAATAVVSRALGLPVLGVPSTPGVSLRGLVVATMTAYLAFNLLTFGLIAGTVHAALYHRDLRARQVEQADLEARVARAELGLLRMQLQPHFLFNTLHTASALMERDVLSARRVLAALGDLLRLSIDELARPEISLRQELDFLGRYVDIQLERHRHRLAVHVAVADELLDALVPSLMLQPLVENAIRHGIERHTRAGQVWISAGRDGSRLSLIVRDDGVAGGDHGRSSLGGSLERSGVGLANLSARLKHLYGSAHDFDAGRDETGGFRVAVRIPFHTLGA